MDCPGLLGVRKAEENFPADLYNFRIEQVFEGGKFNSPPFKFQDFYWHIKILRTVPSAILQLHLENYEKSKIVEVSAGKIEIEIDSKEKFWKRFTTTFKKNQLSFELFSNLNIGKPFKVTIWMRINVRNSAELQKKDYPDFTKKHPTSNVELRFVKSTSNPIPVQKLHCNMQLLRLNSKLFADFGNNWHRFFTLDDNIEEFMELLKLIYPGGTKIDDSNVVFLMKLSEKYKMPHVFEKCTNAISDSGSEISLEIAIFLADKYKIPNILNKIMGRIVEFKQIEELERSKFYQNFGDDTKSAITEKSKFLRLQLAEIHELLGSICLYWL